MSRRDTIIIAVLVNAGLLLVLFATAFKTEKKESPNSTITNEMVKLSSEPFPKNHSLSDEVESVLNQFATAPTLNKASEDFLLTDELELPISQSEKVFLTPSAVSKKSDSTTLKPSSLEKQTDEMILVTVKKGDVLEKIAKVHQTSVAALMKANSLSSTQLKIGQVLKVPAKEGSTPILSPQPSAAMEYYVVKEGDSPWLIATKNHVKVDELLKLNNLDEQKARKLRPGDRLRIR